MLEPYLNVKILSRIYEPIILPSYEEVKEDKKHTQTACHSVSEYRPVYRQTNGRVLRNKGYIVQNPPALPLTQQEMDDVYALPYTEKVHPMYDELGGIPALEEIKFSLTSNRGCFGGCNFCALTFHQGRILQTRSHESLIEEATRMTKDPGFKTIIHDVGGLPQTSDSILPETAHQGVCKNKQCLFPTPCKNLTVDHSDYVALLRKLRRIPGVKKYLSAPVYVLTMW